MTIGECFWYALPGQRAGDPGYFLFRRRFTAGEGDAPRCIMVSADNRYKLYLDGEFVGCGPCRSDLLHYDYDEYALEPGPGEHVLAVEVLVWRGGWRTSAAPWSEVRAGGGLLVAGGGLELPHGWKCSADPGRRSLEWDEAWSCPDLVPAPPMEAVDFNVHDSRWKSSEFDDSAWCEPVMLGEAVFAARNPTDPATPWLLRKRPIGFMRREQTSLPPGCPLPGELPAGKQMVRLDLGENRTSMIHLAGIGGGGTIRLSYAETANVPGYGDRLTVPEGRAWKFDSFWYRPGRFVTLEAELAEPCRITGFLADFISYDFGPWRTYSNPEHPRLEELYRVAVHTARCCAHETFEDCPYWEQLQYAGDTRVQALVSYLATGNGSLGRHAIGQFDASRLPCGLTQSRCPSAFPQVIPGFSLIWILSIQDYRNCFPDDADWIGGLSDGVRSVLDYFERLRRPDGLIGHPGFWDFTDWTDCWPGGRSCRDADEPETILNLFYVLACRAAYGMYGEAEFARRAERTRSAVLDCCLNPERRLLRDVPGREWYSVHANALGILAGCFNSAFEASERLLNEPSLVQCSLYFKFYELEAMRLAGNRRGFLRVLDAWTPMLEAGCTTFPEIPAENARSKCHGWSASPAYELLRGIPEERSFVG